MKPFNRFIITIGAFFFSNHVAAQVAINGKVVDAADNAPIPGATIVLTDHSAGAVSDESGSFVLNVPRLPVTVIVSFSGYDNQEVVFTTATPPTIKMVQSSNLLNETIVKAERVSAKEKEEPLTVESIGIKEIKEVPSASFYESLGNLKGVDITSASLGFRVINTRGFNSTSPVRSLQLIDGVDNQSPGLNFSLGNFLGASDLDVKRVELIAGASSAYFGPNAFNGVINMETKDPFIHRGLDVSVKGGERNLGEAAFRFADVFTNKEGREVLAFKVSFLYFEAKDWKATNYDPTTDSEMGRDNPGGYDAINVYGDESPELNNDYSDISGKFDYHGLGKFYRDGYKEVDLVNYNTHNLKLNTAVHYRFRDSSTIIYAYNRSSGSTVYQGDNRYRLEDISFWQNRLEYRKEDRFFIRAYSTQEDAGKSYDIVSTGIFLNEATYPDNEWNLLYKTMWKSGLGPLSPHKLVQKLPCYVPWKFPSSITTWVKDTLCPCLDQHPDSLFKWHQTVRDIVNKSGGAGKTPRYEPGTDRFDRKFNEITSTKFNQGGTRFFDRSALYHIHGEYMFKMYNIDMRVGANGRMYKPNSDGTIFIDTGGNRITNTEYGVYAGAEANVYNNRVKLNLTGRMDKNQNFDYLFSPALSAVYKLTRDHIFRISGSSAIRNPTLADQYLYYNVGRAILLGNLNGFDSLITLESFVEYRDSQLVSKLEYIDIDPIRPEKVKSLEVGYKGTLLDKSLYIDGSYYYSWYTDFIGYVIGLDAEFDRGFPKYLQAYRLATNAQNRVTTQGFSVSVSYYHKKLAYTGNYSWNVLNKKGTDDPIIPAFNTPEHKFNIGLSGRRIKLPFDKREQFGFGINYKWVDGFVFEGSPQFTGFVPRYDMVDAQVNYTIEKYHCTIKIGGSNLLGIRPLFNKGSGEATVFDNRNFQVYGGPYVGRMAYVSLLFEFHKLSALNNNKKKELNDN